MYASAPLKSSFTSDDAVKGISFPFIQEPPHQYSFSFIEITFSILTPIKFSAYLNTTRHIGILDTVWIIAVSPGLTSDAEPVDTTAEFPAFLTTIT